MKIGAIGYGTGQGEIIFHTSGTSLLVPAAQLRVNWPWRQRQGVRQHQRRETAQRQDTQQQQQRISLQQQQQQQQQGTTRQQNKQQQNRTRGSLLQALRVVSQYHFRPGSVRVAFVVRCSQQDIPEVSESSERFQIFIKSTELIFKLESNRHIGFY